ncbi:MAG: Holliday junction resolvase RecU [Peptostreptococcaceae bacterium]|nr:Holliday junction resolvase RecU [Peptostreptococcaceae bacterium]
MKKDKDAEIFKNYKNNAAGRLFENGIEIACGIYKEKGIASITKIPEPFRVLEKTRTGIFKGRFIAKAQPDFQGTLADGRSIIFEAKYTSTETIKKNTVTQMQAEVLEEHFKLGAKAGVCVGIQEEYFFVPWEVWREMEKVIGKKSATKKDLKPWSVKWYQGIMFLG